MEACQLAIDSETTGVDFSHGTKAFLITTCDASGVNTFWEADVDPLTREPLWSVSDLQEIKEHQAEYEKWIFHNARFDVRAETSIGLKLPKNHWERTWDTLLAAHLLASNQPHDLTTISMIYLGVNLKPFEDRIEEATNKARTLARSKFPEWRIAKKDLEEMPSAKEKTWKFDMWLPRCIAKELDYPDDHPWWTVASEYANPDTAVLLPLAEVMFEEIQRRGLWSIYVERLKLLRVSYLMENYGVSGSITNQRELRKRFKEEGDAATEKCHAIAASYDYELELPKGATNNSLRTFVFDVMKLPPVKNGKAKSDAPSLDKKAMEYYETILNPRSREATFVKALKTKRQRGTGDSYLASYQKFWRPTGIFNDKGEQLWFRMYPSLNMTGTDTLRWSSSNPNEQNISKQEESNLRYCFGPLPGREWWAMDAQNIELRIPAYEANELEMIALFERPKDPPFYGSNHLLNFSVVYPALWAKLVKEHGIEKAGRACKDLYKSTWHQWCKNGGFACQYGAGIGTADLAFHAEKYSAEFNGGVYWSCYDALKSRFANLTAHNDWCIAQANKYGYVETIPDKNVNPLHGYPLLCTRSRWGSILPTVPLNYRTQGTAMWWMAKGMVRCQEFLDELNRNETIFRQLKKRRKTREEAEGGYHMIMQVHDELDFDFPKGNTPVQYEDNKPIAGELKRLMTIGGDDIGVPTLVNSEFHAHNWAEGVPVYF